MVSNNGKNTRPVSSPRLEALMSFLDLNSFLSPCRLMSCWVYEGQKDWTGQSLVSHPGGLETRMSHLPLSDWLYRLVTFDPSFALRLANLLCPMTGGKKCGKGETKRTYTESDAAGQLEPCRHIDIKSCERRTWFYKKRGWNVTCRGWDQFLQGRSCPTLLENILRKTID